MWWGEGSSPLEENARVLSIRVFEACRPQVEMLGSQLKKPLEQRPLGTSG